MLKPNNQALKLHTTDKRSKMGYPFDVNSDVWKLDGSVTVHVSFLKHLEHKTDEGARKTLSRYAQELAATTVKQMISSLKNYLRNTNENKISLIGLSNWRAKLTGEDEAIMGGIKSFLLCWYDWGFPGIDSESAKYLDSLVLKGRIKGKAVKGACPYSGPYSTLEQAALIDSITGLFAENKITLTQCSLFFTLLFTGRRAVQIRSLISEDVKIGKSNGVVNYFVNIPRTKQNGNEFRWEFRKISLNSDLYYVLKNQMNYSIKILESTFGVKLTDKQKLEMPVFINEEVLSEYRTFESLYADSKVKKDLMFLTSLQALNLMADLSVKNEAKSERTGEYIHITSRRFKYSKGTNLYRRGISGVSLAYALDHSDTQHVGVYTENTVEAADIIDQSMATALAPLAQAFAGTLIESEKDAIRANDPHSRVKNEAHNSIGNCGTHDFCTSGLRACYTCVKFQPWKDAPHREVRDFVLEERERQLNAGVSKHVIESSDRLLLAVEQVIQMCDVKTGDNAYE